MNYHVFAGVALLTYSLLIAHMSTQNGMKFRQRALQIIATLSLIAGGGLTLYGMSLI